MTAIAPIFDRRQPPSEPYVGLERRKDWHTPQDCFRFLETQERLDNGSARMQRIEDGLAEVKEAQVKMVQTHTRFEQKLDENSAATSASATATAEILEIISTAKGFFKGAGMLGSFVKWGLGIATAIVAFVLTLKSGGKL